MTKLIAVHALLLASGIKGVADSIEPGQAFNAREDETYLVDIGAARKPHRDEKDMPLAKRAKAGGSSSESSATNTSSANDSTDKTGSQTGEDGSSSEENTPVVLNKMTKAQLISQAEAEEIEVDANGTNAEIITAIEKGRAGKDSGLI